MKSGRVVLYIIRRYLGMTPEEWSELSWATQRAYLEGLSEDENVPFSVTAGDGDLPEMMRAHGQGPRIREGVETGAGVIDLRAMTAELEAARQKGGGSGGV